VVQGPAGAAPIVEVLASRERIPWAGHTGRHALGEVYEAIAGARLTLVFVNTRAQAELVFQELWRLNADGLAIALHHGSLDVEQRRRVEAAMARGALRAVVCTSTLDLGIDWGDVDLVIQLGAPKGSSRLVQRIGRANHRLDEPSRALLAPTNRFEVLECRAAQEAVREGALDGGSAREGGLDCLAQHILGAACGEPFAADDLFAEVRSTAPYAALTRQQFDRAVDFVASGGYALRAYDHYKRILEGADGLWRVRTRAIAQAHRMNVGAIVELTMLNVRLAQGAKSGGPLRAGKSLGKIEEGFIEMLSPSDTFLFAGEVLRLEAVVGEDALVTRAASVKEPRIPSYAGGKFPLSTFLAQRVRALLSQPQSWSALPDQVVEWLQAQAERSILPKPEELLVETFPRGGRWWLVCYPFDGRLAHQTLGMLLTRRLERARMRPQGFVASEYALGVWGLRDLALCDMGALFSQDLLGDDLEEWLLESALMKRTFRNCAVIAGLVERRRPGAEKTGRQVTFSTDLIYDVLRSHEPDHLLLQAARADAGEGYLDLKRLAALLARVEGRIAHIDLPRVSPFAAPVMLEVGREPVAGEAQDAILEEAAEELIADAMRLD
jgi:ATP-dependent Lhr-like helicase